MPFPRQLLTPFQQHGLYWQNCTDCSLCHTRNHRINEHGGEVGVVLGRGQLPCDVLFCGEGPGRSEDVLGKSFSGPAGKMLDQIIAEAIIGAGQEGFNLRAFFTNLVNCLPLDEETGKPDRPPAKAIEACAPRLREVVEMASPQMIVCCGELAGKWVPKVLNGRGDNLLRLWIIEHPASLLRMPSAQFGMAYKRCVVTLSDAFETLVPF